MVFSYLYVKNEQKNFLIKIEKEIDKVTNNKASVSDGYDLSGYNKLVLYKDFPNSLKTKFNRLKNGFGGFGTEMELPTAMSQQMLGNMGGIKYIILTKDSLSYNLNISKSYDIVWYSNINNIANNFNRTFQSISKQLLNGIIEKNKHQHVNDKIDEIRELNKYKNKFYKFSENKVTRNSNETNDYRQGYDLENCRIYFTTKRKHYKIELIEGKLTSEFGLKFIFFFGIYLLICIVVYLIIKIFK